jgi:hypothetical protein
MEKEFEKEVLERLTRIETKIDDYDRLKTKSEEARAKSFDNERRINDLEDKLKWITRTILGGLITGGISIVIIFIKIGLNV